MTARSPGAATPCPTCEAPVDAARRPRPPNFPFCSERCQLADLGRWLDEEYRIPDAADQSASSAVRERGD